MCSVDGNGYFYVMLYYHLNEIIVGGHRFWDRFTRACFDCI